MNNILLTTNLPEFTNDISEEIRLFYDSAHIVESSCECHDLTICANFYDNDDVWKAKTDIRSQNDVLSSYCFDCEAVHGDELTIKRHKKRCIKISIFRALLKLLPDTFVPWGSLTGIRPTKLLRELEDEQGAQNAKQMMIEMFDVSEKKYAVAKSIVDVQRPFINSVKPTDIDIYIGIPYCKTRCLYCSFASDVRTKNTDMAAYIDALKKDIAYGAKIVSDYGYNVRSMYMGGGTPTVLTESELYNVIDFALSTYGGFGCEFTVEAGRPDTITRKKLEILHDFGVGRISINPQTMNNKTLELIGRSHSVEQLLDAFYAAHEIGFDINTDIITCLPGEGMTEVMNTLSYIARMRPENFTVHTLALKRSSRLKQVIGDEEIASIMPDACLADEMVESGKNLAYNLGMNPYYMYRQKYMRGNLENIGYALPGKECIYNIDMMEETVSIMAHGAGSMSKRIFDGRTLRVERIPNPKDITTYIAKVDSIYAYKRRLFER